MLKTIREASVGDAIVRLVQTADGYAGLVLKRGERKAALKGDDPEELWRRLHETVARSGAAFIGYDGARNRFLRLFEGGFSAPRYLADERKYKLDAKAKLDGAAPLGAALTAKGLGPAIRAAYQATTLVSPYEQMRLQSLLKGPEADDFIQAAAAFTQGDRKKALAALAMILKPYEIAKWTVITYLPFLWQPETAMFLKPQMATGFAERVGHPFMYVYRPNLDLEVYDSLLDLARATRDEIADLQPRDMIDVQGFMWTAVMYPDAREPA